MANEFLEKVNIIVPQVLIFSCLKNLPLEVGGPIDLSFYMEWKAALKEVIKDTEFAELLVQLSEDEFDEVCFLIKYVKEVAQYMKSNPGFMYHEESPPADVAKRFDVDECEFCLWLSLKCEEWFLV